MIYHNDLYLVNGFGFPTSMKAHRFSLCSARFDKLADENRYDAEKRVKGKTALATAMGGRKVSLSLYPPMVA